MKKQTWQQWTRAIERDPGGTPSLILRGTLAALTGQDVRALNAIVACWELYACSDEDGQLGALAAVRALLPAMQASTRLLARELIPYALEWSARERLWPLVTGAHNVPPPRGAPEVDEYGDPGDNPLGRAHP